MSYNPEQKSFTRCRKCGHEEWCHKTVANSTACAYCGCAGFVY